jgi:hypothetical protein
MWGTVSSHPKSITDRRSGIEKRCSGREGKKSTFARFLGSSDFRLLQQYRPPTDMPAASVNVCSIAGILPNRLNYAEALAPLQYPRHATASNSLHSLKALELRVTKIERLVVAGLVVCGAQRF